MKLFTRQEIRTKQQESVESLRVKEAKALQALNNKIQKLNEVDTLYPVKLAARQKELAEVELQLRALVAQREAAITQLEDRRKQALKPIIDELDQLEVARQEVQKIVLSLNEKRLELDKLLASIREREEKTKLGEQLLNIAKQESNNLLEHNRLESVSLVKASKEAMRVLADVKIKQEGMSKALEDRRKGAERAESIAKTAMVAADKRIAQAIEEQRKIDDKRKMLALAISVAKKKGIWR